MAVILTRGSIISRSGTPRILPLAPFGGFGLTTFAVTNQARRERIHSIYLCYGKAKLGFVYFLAMPSSHAVLI